LVAKVCKYNYFSLWLVHPKGVKIAYDTISVGLFHYNTVTATPLHDFGRYEYRVVKVLFRKSVVRDLFMWRRLTLLANKIYHMIVDITKVLTTDSDVGKQWACSVT